MFTRLATNGVVCAGVALIGMSVLAQAPAQGKAMLTELQTLKAENFALRRQLVVNQCETFLKQSDAERLTLEQAFRSELKVDPALIFNWQTRVFEPPTEAKK